LEHLDAALKLDPDNIEIHLAMVRAYSKSGRKEDAKRERLLSLNMTKNEAPVARP
jgi:Tfp pilus assembly protein PilF